MKIKWLGRSGYNLQTHLNALNAPPAETPDVTVPISEALFPTDSKSFPPFVFTPLEFAFLLVHFTQN